MRTYISAASLKFFDLYLLYLSTLVMSARRPTFLTSPVNEASQECLIVKECGHKGAPPTIHQSFQRLIAAPTVETLAFFGTSVFAEIRNIAILRDQLARCKQKE